MMSDKSTQFNLNDMVQICIGACIMGFPAAATGEIWDLGEQLPLTRVLLFSVASFIFLAVLIYILHGHNKVPSSRRDFVLRVIATYGLTLLICASMLFGLGQLDLFNEPLVGLKRTIIVAFPASFAATAVDSIVGGNSNSG